MTDSTDNARGPERIWVDDERPIGGSVNVYNEPSEGALKYCVPYVRADLALDPLRAVKVKPLDCEWCVDGFQADGETPYPCQSGCTRSALEPDPLADPSVVALVGAMRDIADGMGEMTHREIGRYAPAVARAALAAFDKGGKTDG